LHNRGISYERLGQYTEAISDFTRVIEIDPDNANAYFNRGCCYDSVGELDLAISDYSVALELDMRNGGAKEGAKDDVDDDN
jgi:Flp pilus assembly protein TadD